MTVLAEGQGTIMELNDKHAGKVSKILRELVEGKKGLVQELGDNQRLNFNVEMYDRIAGILRDPARQRGYEESAAGIEDMNKLKDISNTDTAKELKGSWGKTDLK